jgi:3'-phosphoadenosine 5'-phosphosulfate sulfotransferase (PAPS reductase)/FAD synthetase
MIRPIDELGVDVTPEIAAAAAAGAVFVFNVSGGKDGLCAADAANRWLDSVGHPRSRRYAMHADLGRTEWPETHGYVEDQATYLGTPLILVRRELGDLVDLWEQRYADGLILYDDLQQIRLRGPWSGPGQKFCQASMKRDQFVKTLRHRFPNDTVVCVIGVRRDESRDRAKAETFSFESRLSTKGRTVGLNWNAIAHWTTDEVFAYAAARRLPMHEAYARWGSSRLSCALCVFSSKPDVRASLSHVGNHPLYHTLVGIENRTGFPFQRSNWLSDARPDLLAADEVAAAASARRYSDERKAIEALVPDAFLAGSKTDPWPRRAPEPDEARAIAEGRRLVASWRGIELAHLTASSVTDRIAEMMSGVERIAA